MAIEWLDSEVDPQHDDEKVYPLDKAKAKYEVREICKDGWLVLNWDEQKLWLKFAVLGWCTSDSDGSNVLAEQVFYGEGPSGNLRECRHTWWGENGGGYLFYPKAKVIKAGLDALAEFYDLEE